MLRFGKISKVDASKGLYKVDLEEDDLETGWLSRILLNTKNTKDEAPFEVNERVACMMDEHVENGVIIGAVNSEQDLPVKGDPKIRRTEYPDGSFIEFDGNTNTYEINVTGDIKITSAQKLIIESTNDTELKCTNFKVTGDVKITGDVDVTGKMDATGNITTSTGNVKATIGDVQASTHSLSNHVHPIGSPNTGPPTP